jgi:hypothetical protein
MSQCQNYRDNFDIPANHQNDLPQNDKHIESVSCDFYYNYSVHMKILHTDPHHYKSIDRNILFLSASQTCHISHI